MITAKFLINYNCFKKGDEFKFNKGVTLVVGDQGCGKSTLLECMGKYSENLKKIEVKSDEPLKTFYLDFEKNNPRMSQYYNGPLDLHTRFQSHGESVKLLLGYLTDPDSKDALIIMDEPDMSLSIRSCNMLSEQLKKFQEEGRWIIMSAHNPIIISSMETVYSLEHRKYMSSKEFIESHLKPLDVVKEPKEIRKSFTKRKSK